MKFIDNIMKKSIFILISVFLFSCTNKNDRKMIFIKKNISNIINVKEEKWNGNPFFGLRNVPIHVSGSSELIYFSTKNNGIYRVYITNSTGFKNGDFNYFEFDSKYLKNNDTIEITKNSDYLKINGVLRKLPEIH